MKPTTPNTLPHRPSSFLCLFELTAGTLGSVAAHACIDRGAWTPTCYNGDVWKQRRAHRAPSKFTSKCFLSPVLFCHTWSFSVSASFPRLYSLLMLQDTNEASPCQPNTTPNQPWIHRCQEPLLPPPRVLYLHHSLTTFCKPWFSI